MELLGVGVAEAEEPHAVGAVSMAVHREGATEVEEQCWVADMALIAART